MGVASGGPPDPHCLCSGLLQTLGSSKAARGAALAGLGGNFALSHSPKALSAMQTRTWSNTSKNAFQTKHSLRQKLLLQ